MFKKLFIITLIALVSLILFTGCPEEEVIDPDAYGWWLETDSIGNTIHPWGEVIFTNNNIHEIYDVDWINFPTAATLYYYLTPDDSLVSASGGSFETLLGYTGSYIKWTSSWGYLCKTITLRTPYPDYYHMERAFTLNQVSGAPPNPVSSIAIPPELEGKIGVVQYNKAE